RTGGGPSAFPQRPGSHLKMSNTALEFVKPVCHVLSLDRSVDDEVSKLRRALLRLVGVADFTPQSEFVDPCLTYIIPDMVCQRCNSCRDLDLCRDLHIVEHE
ncbi:Pole, partial [Symbiodinium sp. KB8]